MQRLRIETDHSKVLEYIQAYDYPNKIWLKEPWMMDFTICVRVFDEYETVGYIWCHWVDDHVLSAHAGTIPGAKLEWNALLGDLMVIADFLGAEQIGLSFDNVERADALIRLVTRLGFDPFPDNPYGLQKFYRRNTHG